MLTGNAKSIFRENITCFGAKKCSWNRYLPKRLRLRREELDFGKLWTILKVLLSRLNVQKRSTSVHPLDAHVARIEVYELVAKMKSGNPCWSSCAWPVLILACSTQVVATIVPPWSFREIKDSCRQASQAAVNRSHCWAEGPAKTTLSWSPKGLRGDHCRTHSDCRVENTEVRCSHRNRHHGWICLLTDTVHSDLKPQVNLLHLFNLLDVNTPKNARSSRKVEEDKVTLCGAPSSCNVFAFSGRNQAHNLTSIFHMNVLSNILTGVLEGSSARVLQCSPFPTDTGAVFNSFSKQSCLQTNCSLSPYLCPVGCFREILFKQTRNCHSYLLPGRRKVYTSLLYEYRHWNSVKLCIFLVGCHPSDWLLLSFEKKSLKMVRIFRSKSSTQFDKHFSHECPFKHSDWSPGGVICQVASMLPISYWHGCCFQLLFQTVLPTNKLQLVSLSVSCRLLSRNSVQTNKELSLEPVGFFRHIICFLGAWR